MKGNILEGTTFSFFGVLDGIVVTPEADGRILGSVTRKALLSIMKEEDINHYECKVSVNDIQKMSEAFIASANRDLIPVISIDNKILGDGQIGKFYSRLMKLYHNKINQ